MFVYSSCSWGSCSWAGLRVGVERGREGGIDRDGDKRQTERERWGDGGGSLSIITFLCFEIEAKYVCFIHELLHEATCYCT